MRELDDFSPQVIEAAQDGDQDAWVQIIKGTQEGTTRIAYHYTDTYEDAEDVAQETALAIWENREKLDPTKGITPLFNLVSKRKGIDYTRRAKRRGTVINNKGELFPSLIPSDKPSVEEQVLLFDDIHRAVEAIDDLPDLQRSVMRHRHLLGQTIVETAQAIGTTPGAVKSAESRGKRKVKEALT